MSKIALAFVGVLGVIVAAYWLGLRSGVAQGYDAAAADLPERQSYYDALEVSLTEPTPFEETCFQVFDLVDGYNRTAALLEQEARSE